MTAQPKPSAEDTRARIAETAEALFRRMGFAKTAVADIAAELGMSPANVYRFFPSKVAIVETICRRVLGGMEEKVWTVARSRSPAPKRLERLIQEILAYHKATMLNEQRVHDMVLVAMENNWDAILAHKEVMRSAVEVILRDGVEAGQFEPVDPRATSEVFMRSTIGLCHPVLIAQALQDGRDLGAEATQTVRFLLRAITPRS